MQNAVPAFHMVNATLLDYKYIWLLLEYSYIRALISLLLILKKFQMYTPWIGQIVTEIEKLT